MNKNKTDKIRKSGNCGCMIAPTGILYCGVHAEAFRLYAIAQLALENLRMIHESSDFPLVSSLERIIKEAGRRRSHAKG